MQLRRRPPISGRRRPAPSVSSLVAVLVAVSAPLLASAPKPRASAGGDWPQWRGPGRDGRSPETGLLHAWPRGGPPLEWTARGLGEGYSTVSVAGDRIYTMGDLAGASRLVALDRRTGKLLWTVRVGRPGAPGWGGFKGPRSTPTVAGGAVFALGQYGELVCFDAASGKERWRTHLVDDLGGERPEWGFAESPLADGSTVLCTPGGSRGTIAALDARTGEVRWRSTAARDEAGYASIVPARIEGVEQYVQLTPASVLGVAARGGKVLWRAPRKGSTAVIPTPIVSGSEVYVTSGYGAGCNLFRITRSGSTFRAAEVYDGKQMVNHHGGVVLAGGHVYGYSDGKGWVCQELRTGRTRWREKRRLGKGSVVYADGHLIARAEGGRGTVALLEATPEGYREKGRFDQPGRSKQHAWAHPVVAGGRLYLRDQKILLCYRVTAAAKAGGNSGK